LLLTADSDGEVRFEMSLEAAIDIGGTGPGGVWAESTFGSGSTFRENVQYSDSYSCSTDVEDEDKKENNKADITYAPIFVFSQPVDGGDTY